MAESDEWATVETVPDGIIDEEPTVQVASGPTGVVPLFMNQAVNFLTLTNPWTMLSIGLLLFAFRRKIKNLVLSLMGTSNSEPTLTPDEVLARQEALEAARRRMQEEYERKAQEYAVKQKEKEEKARLEKLKNLEKYGSKLGKSTKVLVAEDSTQEQAELSKKKKDKPKLRQEYNPLMGDSSAGVCFRPSRRGGAGGG